MIAHSELINKLNEATGLTDTQLYRIIIRSPHTYKVYSIPKRSGGTRTIAQPAKETKFLQRWLINNIFEDLPLHECATAYKKNSSIKKNADAHKNNIYIFKYDFRDFFSSINETDLIQHFTKYLINNISENDIRLVARLSCIFNKQSQARVLSIGAPSSPLLSNSVMFDFDCEVSNWCNNNGFVFTRYADDITISTSKKGNSLLLNEYVSKAIFNLSYPKIQLNSDKTIHLSKKHQRRVTGLIITNENQLSIGRFTKRKISALIHQFKLAKLSNDDTFYLQGLLGFAKNIEPEFIVSMRKKYSCAILDSIFQIRSKIL